jgi:hypothetical protein
MRPSAEIINPDTKQTRDDHNKTRPIYLLRLQPVHGDGVNALRRLLKFALRVCHLRCTSVSVEHDEARL